jgi:hypothetical protein
MAQFDAAVRNITADERAVLEARAAAARRDSRLSVAAMLAGTVLGLVIVCMVFVQLEREVRTRRASGRRLVLMNRFYVVLTHVSQAVVRIGDRDELFHRVCRIAVEDGQFRSDLYFRLNVVSLPVPPLRARREDVPELARVFVERSRRRNPSSRARRLSSEVLERFRAYHWPGNVRELENLIERLVILSQEEEIGAEDLDRFAPRLASGPFPLDAAKEQVVKLRELEDMYIAWMLARCGGNKTRAAEILGIDVSTIHRRERERTSTT